MNHHLFLLAPSYKEKHCQRNSLLQTKLSIFSSYRSLHGQIVQIIDIRPDIRQEMAMMQKFKDPTQTVERRLKLYDTYVSVDTSVGGVTK